jgi:hypothetical protein
MTDRGMEGRNLKFFGSKIRIIKKVVLYFQFILELHYVFSFNSLKHY